MMRAVMRHGTDSGKSVAARRRGSHEALMASDGLHAYLCAAKLGHDIDWPKQYLRAKKG